MSKAEYNGELKCFSAVTRELPIISEQMNAAGLQACEELKETYPDYLLVNEIYKAMWLADRKLGE